MVSRPLCKKKKRILILSCIEIFYWAEEYKKPSAFCYHKCQASYGCKTLLKKKKLIHQSWKQKTKATQGMQIYHSLCCSQYDMTNSTTSNHHSIDFHISYQVFKHRSWLKTPFSFTTSRLVNACCMVLPADARLSIPIMKNHRKINK